MSHKKPDFIFVHFMIRERFNLAIINCFLFASCRKQNNNFIKPLISVTETSAQEGGNIKQYVSVAIL